MRMGSEPKIVPFEDVTHDDLATLVRAVGTSRFLVEEPFAGPTPGQYLVDRILGDSRRNDAVARAMMVGDDLTGFVVLRFPEWDRQHFGFPVGRVEHLEGRDGHTVSRLLDYTVSELAVRGVRMCSARLSADALMTIHYMESRGFRFQELTLNPWRALTTWERKGYGVTRPAEPQDVPLMRRIARRAFRTDRFHRDARFSADTSDALYERWVITWHKEDRPGRHSVVLVVDGSVAGFLLYEVSARTHGGATIGDLVLGGLDPDAAGKGNGFMLWCDVLDALQPHAQFAPATVAAANPTVVNMYAKLGFHVTSSGEVTLHWWSEGQGEECGSW